MKAFTCCAGALLLALIFAGCAAPKTKPAAAAVTNMDQLLGREPLAVRQEYVKAHPDLDPTCQQYVLAGTLRTADAEQLRQADLQRRQDDAADTQRLLQARAQAEEARKAYTTGHPEVSPEIRNGILEQRLVVGMTADQVKLAYGAPKSVHSTTTAAGLTETWTFYGRSVVATLSNGRLTAFAN